MRKKEEDGEHGRTLMELLELEMRARAIKALLMKAGKEEGEAETLAIEEALDEAKKKEGDKDEKDIKEEKDVGEAKENGAATESEKATQSSSTSKRNIRQRIDSGDQQSTETKASKGDEDTPKVTEETKKEEENTSRVFNSENKAMNKAREMLMLSENKKIIEDEIKSRKEQEAIFLYEEQMRKEKMEKDRIERERLAAEARERKQKLIEKEQEERRKILDKEREKMVEDHRRKEELKREKDKEKLFSKIRAMKEAEEREKEELAEHQRTKMLKKKNTVEQEEGETAGGRETSQEEKTGGETRHYRKKEEEEQTGDDEISAAITQADQTSPRIRKPYDRDDNPVDKKRNRLDSQQLVTRPKKKVEGGSDVEDGEVEEVDSDAEDEVEREDEHKELLQKIKNLRSSMSTKLESSLNRSSESNAASSAATPTETASVNRGHVRTKGRRKGKPRGGAAAGEDEEDNDWSLKKYDFEAPDMEATVKDHKPNFVKAPRRVFEKHDGYYSDGEDNKVPESKEEKSEIDKKDTKKSEATNKSKKQPGSTFKKVTREEWNKMSKVEQKRYMKERKKRKQKDTVYIKDDSDNEQLVSSGSDDGVGDDDFNLSSSEDEKEREERLAKLALKSYAQSFTAEEHPDDYKIVMRKEVWEKEMAAEVATTGDFDTLEDIELRDKREKADMKEKEKKEKIRMERLKRIQAFQTSSILRSQPEMEEDNVEEEEEEEERAGEVDGEETKDSTEKEDENNPFYTSYKEAIVGDGKETIEDPLKEERLRRQQQQKEDEEALQQLQQQKADSEGDKDQQRLAQQARQDAKKRKLAELAAMRNRRRPDPNNPSKEELDAQQELEKMTWEDRWNSDQKMKEVFTSSKLVSKAKMKMKVSMGTSGADESKKGVTKADTDKPKQVDSAATASTQAVKDALPVTDTAKDNEDKPPTANSAEKPTVTDLPGLISSVDEYATILGKTPTQLLDDKNQPPELSESEGEESPAEDEGDLWGAIMGGS